MKILQTMQDTQKTRKLQAGPRNVKKSQSLGRAEGTPLLHRRSWPNIVSCCLEVVVLRTRWTNPGEEAINVEVLCRLESQSQTTSLPKLTLASQPRWREHHYDGEGA